jgi:hypothetical protein
MMKLILLAGLLGMAAAECPDACNGHGFCGQFDKCSCYRNWMGNSCDKRTCPYDLAFVDLPAGDLNMDGSDEFKAANAATAHVAVTFGAQINNRKGYEVWPHDATETKEGGFDQAEDAHFYAECSNKGMCDRKSGLCSCFDGYEGTACRRVVCPNDCSGHGTCETMQEFTQEYYRGRAEPANKGDLVDQGAQRSAAAFPYNLWDRYKSQVCQCDPGYFGIDCAQRYCPRGDDPLTTDQTDETQWLDVNCGVVACSGTFRIAYTDTYGETWDTMPITLQTFDWGNAANNVAYATRIATALKGIPNSVIEGVSVTVTAARRSLCSRRSSPTTARPGTSSPCPTPRRDTRPRCAASPRTASARRSPSPRTPAPSTPWNAPAPPRPRRARPRRPRRCSARSATSAPARRPTGSPPTWT